MPGESTVYAWVSRHKEFRDIYVRARESWAEAQLERVIEAAQDGSCDTYIDKKTGEQRTNHEAIGRSRLYVDTLKWALARMNRVRFADTATVDMTNSDGSLAAPADPKLITQRIEAIYQKALASRPTTDAVFEEIPDDGSDLC